MTQMLNQMNKLCLNIGRLSQNILQTDYTMLKLKQIYKWCFISTPMFPDATFQIILLSLFCFDINTSNQPDKRSSYGSTL